MMCESRMSSLNTKVIQHEVEIRFSFIEASGDSEEKNRD